MIPERELTGDLRVLVDSRHHLPRPVDQSLLGEAIDDQFAVVLSVGPGDHPARQVVLAAWSEGKHEDELFFLLSGELHDRVVGAHRPGAPVGLLRRCQLPLVFLVVEDLWLFHVVGRIDRCLEAEDVLGVPQVRPQVGRHLRERPEGSGQDLLPRFEDRIFDLGPVERHPSVIGVDDRLDRVADVVDATHPLRVRVAIADRVPVGDPVEPPLRDDEVGILIEAQVGRDPVEPVENVAMEEDPALTGDVVGEEQLHIPKAGRKGQPAPVSSQRNAPGPFVAGVDVLFSSGIVELLRGGPDIDRIVRELAVVDLRRFDLE